MTHHQINLAMALMLGRWRETGDGGCVNPRGVHYTRDQLATASLPAYATDLNLIVRTLNDNPTWFARHQPKFAIELQNVINRRLPAGTRKNTALATAEEYCEALLRAAGRWETYVEDVRTPIMGMSGVTSTLQLSTSDTSGNTCLGIGPDSWHLGRHTMKIMHRWLEAKLKELER